MGTSISSTSTDRILLVTSVDEAVSLTRATEIFQADTFIAAALMGVQTAKPLLDRFAQLSKLSSLISERASRTYQKISVNGLETTAKSAAALRNFFNQDGPVLGEDLDQANANYAALTNAGIHLSAPIQIPVLIEFDRKDGGPPIKSINWYPVDQISSLDGFPKNNSSKYPGSVEHINDVTDSNGKVIQSFSYTVFEDYSNRRPTLTAMADGLVVLKTMVNEVVTQIALELKFAQRAAAEAEKKMNISDIFKENNKHFLQNIESSNNDLIEASLRLRQFLHRERQLLMIRQDAKEESDLDRMQLDASNETHPGRPVIEFDASESMDERRGADLAQQIEWLSGLKSATQQAIDLSNVSQAQAADLQKKSTQSQQTLLQNNEKNQQLPPAEQFLSH